MKLNTLLYKIYLTAISAGVLLFACKKAEELQPMRQFMPAGDISVSTGESTATLNWNPSINVDTSKQSYTIIVSTDSTFSNGPQFSYKSDSSSITLYDTQLGVRKKYYARVKSNGADSTLDSKWLNSNGFTISGEQIFLAIRETELRDTSVVLHWKITADVTKITLTPSGGTAVNYTLSASEIAAGEKKINGLTAAKGYSAEIFTAVKSKGFLQFTTASSLNPTFIIQPSDNLVTVLDTCSNGAVIGLAAGTYTSGAATNFTIKEKSVTLKSLSGNPNDTRVNFKEFTLKGTGAGIKLIDLELAGVSNTSLYFINLVGTASDAAAATFTSVELNNCIVHDYANCLMRANRGTAAGDHKITNIRFRNCLVYNNLLTNLYTEFTLEKLKFEKLELSNSTFYNIGRALVSASTAMSVIPVPDVTISGCTFNNLGAGSGLYVLLDANTNPITANITNSIFANTPRTGTLASAPVRATGSGTAITFSYNNTFNLNNSLTTPAALAFPSYTYLTMTQNRTENLGWTAATTNFTLPAGSILRNGGISGVPIGDPRWAY